MRMQTLKPRVQALKRMSNVAEVTVERLPGRTAQDRNRRFLHHNPLCAECLRHGRFSAAQEVDHIIPLWKGGTEDESNLQGLDRACHKLKTLRELAERNRGF